MIFIQDSICFNILMYLYFVPRILDKVDEIIFPKKVHAKFPNHNFSFINFQNVNISKTSSFLFRLSKCIPISS